MSAQEMLLDEIKRQPEPVLREVLHYLKYLIRSREEEARPNSNQPREVDEDVAELLDGR